MGKLTKEGAEEKIKDFFKNLKDKHPREIKKAKKLAMKHNIKLGNLRKKFCKKCYFVFPQNAEIKIKNKIKVVRCKNCGYVSRWKLR